MRRYRSWQSVWGSDALQRRRAKGPQPESEPIDDSTLVFPGFISTPTQDKGLAVEISKSGGDIVMRTGKSELGRWPLTEATIHAIDATSFAFTAEGDHLVFTPDDPAVFAASALVTAEVVEDGRRKRRKTKKAPVATEPAPDRGEASTRKQRRAATKAETLKGSTVTGRVRDAEASETQSREPFLELQNEPEEPSDAWHPTRWVWFVDVARRNRFFGLDRVPIDETSRGFKHEHSWDHRVATRSGFASHVCTICGRIRLKSRR